MSKLLLKETHEEVLPIGNTAAKWNPQQGGADAEAEALRREILNAADNLVITGTTYYISPNGDDANDGTSPKTAWKTVDAVMAHHELIKAGDGVLFERGGVYRSQVTLTAEPMDPFEKFPPVPVVIETKSGVSYGAYGKGPKPAIYSSFKNYAWEECWEPTEYPNIWKVETPYCDCGVIVFNHGEEAGIKRFMNVDIQSLDGLKENFEFYHDFVNGVLYLFLDKGCPHEVYDDIEVCPRDTIFYIPPDSENVTIDNLAIKYTGHYGIAIKSHTKKVTITNCEMGWIGGCEWMYHPGKGSRLGNAVEFWEHTEDALIANNWVYQVYDAGLSPQGIRGGVYRNVVMRKNLVEYCVYNIEWFDRDPNSVWDGYYIEDNILRFAGYGWGNQRKVDYATSNICGWTFVYDNPLRVYIRNNILDCSAHNNVFWHWADGRPYPDAEISGNTFYEKPSDSGKAMYYAGNEQLMASDQAEFEAAIKTFDSEPKLIKWLP